MIIQSISLKNFQCYFGEHVNNYFKFEEGLNLIIGNNGGGKSKLFDAFFWVIYDQIFDSFKREFVSTAQFEEKLISDKAKTLSEIGDTISAEVILNAITSKGKEYRITRILNAKKVTDDSWKCDPKSKLLIDEMKLSRWQSVQESRHATILNTVIPDQLKTYMWFQGEQVDSLMNLTDKDALTRIINLISKIQDYDELIAILQKGEIKATRSYRSSQSKLSKNKSKFDDINKKITSVKTAIAKTQESIETHKQNLDFAKDKIEELIGLVDNAAKRSEIKNKKERLEKDLQESSAQLEMVYKGLHKNLFKDFWVLRNAKPFFDKFSNKYNDYFIKHSKVVTEANAVEIKLPINIPQPIHVNKMLDEELCFVCGREAKKGTAEYEHIHGLLVRNEISEEELFKNDCSSFYSDLYNNGLSYSKFIDRIDENINLVFENISSLRKKIQNSRSKLNELKLEFGDSLDSDQSSEIISAFRIHESNREKYQSLINNEESDLILQNTVLKKFESEIEGLVKADGGKIEKDIDAAYHLFSKLLTLADATKNEVFEALIKELEESSNFLFKMMTKDNKAVSGKIKINCSSHSHCVAQIIGNDGVVLSNPNDSNLVLVKLALIMAIIQSKETWSDNYTFITDAPTSKMAAEYSNGFYRTISQTFKQSIVTTYDFVKPEERGVLKGFNVSKAYLIEPEYPHGDSGDTSDLNVLIQEII